MSCRLYIGNLDKQVTEEDITHLFSDKDLASESVLLKSGYAFVDCDDPSTVDSAIDKLSGLQLYDKVISVEPAVTKSSGSGRTKLSIRNVPTEMSEESLRETLSQYGTVKDLSRRNEFVHVLYSTSEQAHEAKDKLQEVELEGQKLKVEFVSRRPQQPRMPVPQLSKQDFPLRVLVPHQHVGAIIGRSGQTIRNITQQTNARVDVVRRDNSMHEDKVVLIMGAETQNCVEACQEILKVMNTEGAGDEASSLEIELRILAHNNLCGRLIGKQGVIIKAIMEETGTTLTVSSANSIGPMNADRVVTIKGSLDAVGAATTKVYNKLKACHEADIQNPKYPHMMGQGPMAPMQYQPWNMASPYTDTYGAGRGGGPSMYPPHPNGMAQSTAGGHMTCFLYIPKASVGAVIGSKGSFINHVKQESRASCQVQEGHGDAEANERPVKITGYPDCVWKAQWYIFEKVKIEGFAGNEYAKLRCEVLVPKKMVGRIIGKGGRNVRHIQDISDATIKLPDEQDPEVEEVAVEVIGNIYSQTLAQALIRQLIVQGQLVAPFPPPMMRGPRPPGPQRYMGYGRQGRGDNRNSQSTE